MTLLECTCSNTTHKIQPPSPTNGICLKVTWPRPHPLWHATNSRSPHPSQVAPQPAPLSSRVTSTHLSLMQAYAKLIAAHRSNSVAVAVQKKSQPPPPTLKNSRYPLAPRHNKPQKFSKPPQINGPVHPLPSCSSLPYILTFTSPPN